jgi:hypothetical protein
MKNKLVEAVGIELPPLYYRIAAVQKLYKKSNPQSAKMPQAGIFYRPECFHSDLLHITRVRFL